METINLRVVDIYQGDNVSSLKKAFDFGIRGVIHKATTGATGNDKKYANRRPAAIKAGLLWGAYHWGTNADVGKQVDNFLKTADPDAQHSRRSRLRGHPGQSNDARPGAEIHDPCRNRTWTEAGSLQRTFD